MFLEGTLLSEGLESEGWGKIFLARVCYVGILWIFILMVKQNASKALRPLCLVYIKPNYMY